MKPYDPGLDPGELGGVGEGMRPLDSAQPLTQLQLGNRLPSLRNPLPMGEGGQRDGSFQCAEQLPGMTGMLCCRTVRCQCEEWATGPLRLCLTE